MTVSVIVPARNAATTLGEALEGLAQQVHPFAWEVIVADHASTDATAAVAQEWSGRLPLRVVPVPPGGGVSRARNTALANARGEYVLVCDADDIVMPGWVEAMVRALEHADIVGGDRLPFCTNERAYGWTAVKPGARQEGLIEGAHWPFASGGCLGLRVAAIGDVKFPEHYDWGGGDEVAFCWNVMRAGGRIAPAPGAAIRYRLRDTLKATMQQRYRWAYSWAALYRDFPEAYEPRSFVRVSKDWVRALYDLLLRRNRARAAAAPVELSALAGRLVGSLRFRVKAW